MKNTKNPARMERPIKPEEPNLLDKKKYPDSECPIGKNYLGDPIQLPNPTWLNDMEKYRKNLEKYNKDIKIWEQIKLIQKIKGSCLKTCLEKYKIEKIK
jgi:hypothetical protein